VRQMLAAQAEQITEPGAVSRRLGAAQPGTNAPGNIQPAARASGAMGRCAGPATGDNPRAGSRSTGSSAAGLPAGRRQRRRDTEMVLVVRRAERGPGLLDGGNDGRSRT